MTIAFTKMHGLGNDFMVVDLVRQQIQFSTEQVRALADRHTGIGFDQLLIVAPASNSDCDFLYRIYNADGDEVEHCGNGARCISQFIVDQGLSDKSIFRFEMANGSVINTELLEDNLVRVDMGEPILAPEKIPFTAEQQSIVYSLVLDSGTDIEISAVSMGNPHAVMLTDDAETADVETLGPVIEHHPAFPNRVNVGFMQVISPSEIRLRVFERGAGETQACGTGACAAVTAGRIRGILEQDVTVHLNGGTLTISWQGSGHPLFMTGPTTTVYEGRLTL